MAILSHLINFSLNLYNVLIQLNYKYIFSLIFLYYVIRPYIEYFRTRKNRAPGPLPWPLVGYWHIYLYGDVAKKQYDLNEKYGDVVEIEMYGFRCILISDPKLLKDLFSPSVRSPFLRRIPLLPGFIELGMDKEGLLLNLDVDRWRHNRKFFQQSLSPPSFIDLSTKYTRECCEEMMDYWRNVNDGTVIRLEEWYRAFTSDMMGLIAAGGKEESMKILYNRVINNYSAKKTKEIQSENKGEKYRQLRSEYPDACAFYIFVPKLLWNLPFIKSRYQYYRNVLDRLTDFEVNFIKERKSQIEEEKTITTNKINKTNKHGGNIKPDFLTMLITMNGEVEPTPDEINQNLREMSSAGTGTTTTTLCTTTYLLAAHPEIEKRMLDEILEVVGPDRPVESSDLPKLEFTEAILNEAMRLYPVVPITYRYSPDYDTQIAGYKFPPNTVFAIDLGHIHRNPKYFKDADKFVPDRFMGKDWKDTIPQFAFSPFGHGMRSCPGKHLAMTEMKVILATLFRKFTFKLVKPNDPLNIKFTLVNDISELDVYAEKRIL
nr:11957_t:CDS:1 [Entrophospora candida]